MKNKLNEFELAELSPVEVNQIIGGLVLPVAVTIIGGYMLWQIAANPQASYQAFMNGWNSY
jgi:hypothetical protein